MPTQSEAIHTYLRAKDENRPHLMKRVFAETADLEVVVETEVISFPPLSKGVDAITHVVRDFGLAFENVYTFCLARPPKSDDSRFSCNWLVGFSEKKENGAVHVGYGRYDWLFQANDPCLVQRLKITINILQVLSPDYLRPVMDWLSNLPYPWCSAEEAINDMPNLVELEGIFNYIGRSRI